MIAASIAIAESPNCAATTTLRFSVKKTGREWEEYAEQLEDKDDGMEGLTHRKGGKGSCDTRLAYTR